MNGYSKIKLMNRSSKSRSMDFSDQTIPTPRIQKPISINKSIITTTHQQPKTPDRYDDDDDYKQYSGNHQEEDANFPMKMLTRNKSVASGGTTANANGTSTPSSRFKIEKQNSTGRALQIAVTRAFSIRRSSSVSERYARIHDQYANPLDDVDHLEAQEQEQGEGLHKKKKSRGSILKTCKRIFGL
ncbi:hypothetical protein Lser_V15G24235 [Lactuca serriola]|uniref:Uncharacterized protein n=1 Tax=Lactuca sativa TaxID=4236 RepID=A0A9R1VGR5_LACSA|nr:hypothetical protein LSAT_V11C500266250 [Lactuca sativa]